MTRLQKYLHLKSLSHRDFGETVGLSASYVGQIARGDQLPSLQTAYDVFQATDGYVQLGDWFAASKPELTTPAA